MNIDINLPLRIFVGFDPRQPVSFQTLMLSIYSKAKVPVAITPLVLQQLPITRTGLTPFTYTRFITPWISDYKGWSLFLDADMLLRADISELFKYADDTKAVMVANFQGPLMFERASVMLFNNAHPDNRKLTPDAINDAQRTPRPHLIDWTDAVGTFPVEWNHLVGYLPPNPAAKLVHYTMGVPAFPEVGDCEHADEWRMTMRAAASALPWAELMGNSVHCATTADGRKVAKLHPDAVPTAA